jgi:hypothetical protein
LCACKEHTNATTYITRENVHIVHTTNPPVLIAMLVPAIKLIITADSIMVEKLATTPSFETRFIAQCLCLMFHFIYQNYPVR